MSSAVRETLTAYVAGRVKADHVVTVVTAAYYRNGGGRRREALRPVLDVIERASDRKSTRLNSSHSQISYAVFCLKKKDARRCFRPLLRRRQFSARLRACPRESAA